MGGALWVLPTIAVVISLIAGAVASQIEVDPDSGFGRVLFQGDASDARELLIVVSATMITVTGLVFSLTVVALQISATQFSPRLLRSFLRDRGTQVVLGVFVSTFAYATAGLYTVGRVENGEPFVPRIAISMALLLALGSVAAFVWYIHHLALSIQIDDVMRRVERATLDVITRNPSDCDDSGLPDAPAHAIVVPAPSSGYIQAFFPADVLGAATSRWATVRYHRGVGDHVVQGSPIAHVWSDEPIDPEEAATIADAGLRIGFERTFEQDAAFGVRQLVDFALRAMSPAINDPYTAEQSIAHISVVLCAMLTGDLGPQIWRDPSGVPRVLVPKHGLAEHLDLACGQLRRVAAHEPRVVAALLAMLGEVAARVSGPAADAVRGEADLLVDDARRRIAHPADLVLVEEAYASVITAITSGPR